MSGSVAAVRDIDTLLAKKQTLDAHARAAPQLLARLPELRAWQAERLARTYKDLRGDPEYAGAVGFFLSDLYGPHDFTSRDQELLRAWRYLKSSLPASALQPLARAVELEVLSMELDQSMIEALASRPLTAPGYGAAYRTVGRRAERLRQIDLAVGAGEELERVVRHVWARTALRLAHKPAHAAGFGVLQGFLERGFAAFRNMQDATPLLQAIKERETRIMESLFAGDDTVLMFGRSRKARIND